VIPGLRYPGESSALAAALATSAGYVFRPLNRSQELAPSGRIMTTNVHCRPERPPPKTWSETAPKRSGASAMASERSRVRTASARPQRSGGMMSSRAASRGGFWAPRKNAAATR